jgi:hypothetical protein
MTLLQVGKVDPLATWSLPRLDNLAPPPHSLSLTVDGRRLRHVTSAVSSSAT